MNKTNALRLLDAADIPYRVCEYPFDESDLGGLHVAEATGMDPDQVFKTLVVCGEKNGYMVLCVPVSCSLELKKAAIVAKDKKVEMLPMKNLLAITGYIRGGCSPIGMKKKFPTFIDETALLYDEIAVSAGARGLQVVINPKSLIEYCEMVAADIVNY